ncbi:hypothetical protein [Alistipes onderdonkii]|uniref:hypothetical protein n=1 Tax=Alistipes onderdonkii TaxID=328813 RepID=UPI00189E5E6E|nr:hypothetical protein [Alistipes onderdonkii]
MVIVILILIFCGAMLLLCRMLCGFTKLLSNSKKEAWNCVVPVAVRPRVAVLLVLFEMCGLV